MNGGAYPRGLIIGLKKRFETSYGNADQNTLCIYLLL